MLQFSTVYLVLNLLDNTMVLRIYTVTGHKLVEDATLSNVNAVACLV